MRFAEPETEKLLDRAGQGDREARNHLLDRYRQRLKAVIALHLDPRLAARIDPSDVVQESLVEADGKLDNYLRTRPLPFYVWLRARALERLADLHRRHVRAQKRSVRREEMPLTGLPDESLEQLAGRLATKGSSPSAHLQRQEVRQRVRAALGQLRETDREVLALRHFEQLSTREIAAVLGITEGAVKVRHLRALQRLRDQLGNLAEEAP